MKTEMDQSGRAVVVVTGMGIVSCLGEGLQDNWAALTAGISGIRYITRFPTEGLATKIAGTIDIGGVSSENAVERSYDFARRAAWEALGQARLSGDFNGPMFLAAPPIEPDWGARFELGDRSGPSQTEGDVYQRFLAAMRAQPDPKFHEAVQFGSVADRLADEFGTRGLPVTLSTACASGATAIQLGVESIRQGRTDKALCIATEGSITAESLIRFNLLSALSTKNVPPEAASKPFSKDRDGFVFSEGAAVLVLESFAAARARGAPILGVVRGCADKVDPFHRTRSSPDGGPAIATIRAALEDAGLAAGQIDYVNAHGTSTPENDKMEFVAMSAVFEDRIWSVPVSANKSMIGHTITAAGAIEAVFSIQTMLSGVIPPTINYHNPDPAIPLDVVPNIARRRDVATVLSNSFGFGGQNASLVMSREVG
ncbi:beta-ketoacyl-ACP synthase [Agrobacterium tumefaciens]|nr:beta-ketoacyl-ACP synthase [Agrobacterium tumefaciens]